MGRKYLRVSALAATLLVGGAGFGLAQAPTTDPDPGVTAAPQAQPAERTGWDWGWVGLLGLLGLAGLMRNRRDTRDRVAR